MKDIEFPVLDVKMVDINKVISNDYNPNKVAHPEIILLRKSIEEDGYTQPIVTYYDKKNDKYIIVDKFHRYLCAKEYFFLKEIPVVTINKSLKNRMASTIRHNRARGSHQIPNMSKIVITLLHQGWNDEEICQQLGMELDEVIRLKQISGLTEAFANHTFSKSWEKFEGNIKDGFEDYEKRMKAIPKTPKSKVIDKDTIVIK